MDSNKMKKLSLSKKTVKNLGVRSGVQTGLGSKVESGRCLPPAPLTGYCPNTNACTL